MTADLDRFRSAIARRLGLFFDDGKLPFLSEILQRRLDATRTVGVQYLADLELDGSRDELRALAAELTVGETYFFRNREQFCALTELVLPELIAARSATRRLSLLSAGTASGEEAYSLAIAIREQAIGPGWDVSIRGIDVNSVALGKAERARYSPWSLRETPAELQERWFKADGREHVLDDSIRRAVVFEERNLADDDPDWWAAASCDVVFCRNMIMYFTPEHQQRLIGRLTRVLAPGGYLFLGHAETLRGLSADFHLCHTHGTFYYQRKPGGPTAHPATADSQAARDAAVPPLQVDWAASWVDTVRQTSERIRSLSERSPPPRAEPARAQARVDVGRALELLAHERFADALELLPHAAGDSEALLLRAVLLAHAGRLDDARMACDELLALDELNAGAHYVLALCCEGAGDRQAALDHDQVASYLDPAFAMPRVHLGLMARRVGDRDVAKRELGQALLLLQREDASRLLLFGGGFSREALITLCRSELIAAGGMP